MSVACAYEEDGIRIRIGLGKRLSKLGLKVNEEKRKVVKYSRNLPNKATFKFLGFRINCGRTSNGIKVAKVKTMGKRKIGNLNRVRAWNKEVGNKYKLLEIWKVLILKLEGHIHYYGVSHNLRSVTTFLYPTKCIVFKCLNCRSESKSFKWKKLDLFVKTNPLPKVRVCHKLY